MADSRTKWDYSLELKGTTPQRLPMARLAAYLTQFAALLGDEAKPVFAGVVKGSALLRAADHSGMPALARSRMRQAAQDGSAPARPAYERIAQLCIADGLRGRVIDRAKAEIIAFPGATQAPAAAREYIVHETAEVDGVVVGVEGTDDTAHLRLIDQATGEPIRIQVRDMAVARAAAKHFRGPVIRVRTHGTWRRDAEGQWHPHSLYADGIEELDDASPLVVFKALRALEGSGWIDMPQQEADALLGEMRSTD